MSALNRRNFLKTLGMAGAGALIVSPSGAAENPPSGSRRKRQLRIAHLTDIHAEPGLIAERGMARALEAVNRLADKPDLIINGGDAIMNAASVNRQHVRAQWNTFHHLLREHNSLPVRHCIGNHDVFGFALPNSRGNTGKTWTLDELELSNNYYRFQQSGWEFIVLDSIHFRKTIPGYYGRFDRNQMNWLRQQLFSIPKSTPVCIVSHIPILAVCTLFDGCSVSRNRWLVPDNRLHADSAELRDLFYKAGNVSVCLSGHIHLIDQVNYLGTDYFCNGAVSGAWWNGNHQQFPPSFAVMNLYDNGEVEREIHFYDWN